MEALFIYFAKVILISAVFWLYYLAFLRGKEFHHYNRFYLLISSVFSLVLPLIKVNWFTIQPNNEMIYNAIVLFNGSSNIENIQQSQLGFWEYAGIGLGIISVFLILKFGYSVFKIQAIKNKYPKETHADYTLVLTDLEYAPFTFLKSLFWNKTIDVHTQNGNKILRHELTHIKEKHTLDRVYFQILKAICWFNPIFYLFNREIALIHEYLADQKAIAKHDTKAFAEMLLSQHYTTMSLQGTSPFFSSTIKKRLEMLTKKHNTKFSYARRVWALPLLLVLSFIYLVQAKNKEIKIENERIESTINTIGENSNSIEKIIPIENDTILSVKIKEILDKYKDENGIPDLSIAPDEEKKLLFSYLSEQYKSLNADSSNHFNLPNFVLIDKSGEGSTNLSITTDTITPQQSNSSSISISNGKLKSKNIDWDNTVILLEKDEISKEELEKLQLSDNKIKGVTIVKDNDRIEKIYGKRTAIFLRTKESKIADDLTIMLDGEVISKEEMDNLSPKNIESVKVIKRENRIEIFTKQNIETPPTPPAPPVAPNPPTKESLTVEVDEKKVDKTNGKVVYIYNPDSEHTLSHNGNGIIETRFKDNEVTIYIDGKKSTRKELETLNADKIKNISINAKENVKNGSKKRKGVMRIKTK